MGFLKTAALSALLAGASITGALAADPIVMPIADNTMPLVEEAPAYDWTGFYAGVYGQGTWSPAYGTEYGIGLLVGANAQMDLFVLGVQSAVHNLDADSSYYEVVARAGVLVTDDLLVFAAAGYGIDTGPRDESHALLGGGVELALNDTVSLEAKYLHGFPITGANPVDQVTIGANFHF